MLKKLISLIVALTIGGIAFAQQQMPQQALQQQQQGQQVCNIPCDNPSDCALRVQCETDFQTMLNLRPAFLAANKAIQNDMQAYQDNVVTPQQQSATATALSAQLAKDQANLAAFKSSSTIITTSTPSVGTGTGS